MNHKRVARTYLNWFQQEALDLSVPTPEGASSLIWSDDGSFAIGYTGPDGFRCYQEFVRSLAQSRLSPASATQVREHAVNLVIAANTY